MQGDGAEDCNCFTKMNKLIIQIWHRDWAEKKEICVVISNAWSKSEIDNDYRHTNN